MEHVLDLTVEALDEAVGLRAHRPCQPVLDVEFGAEPVEVVVAGRGAGAQAEPPIGGLFPLFVMTCPRPKIA